MQPPTEEQPGAVAEALERANWNPGDPLPPGITNDRIQKDHNKLRKGKMRLNAKLTDLYRERDDIVGPVPGLDPLSPLGWVIKNEEIKKVNKKITQTIGGVIPIERKIKILEQAGAKALIPLP
jgi:hypothetical protein